MNTTLLYLGATYDYGSPARGFSYEHRNFHASLEAYCARQGWTLAHYDYRARGAALGRELMTQELYELAGRLSPSLLFAVLTHPEHDPLYEVFPKIAGRGDTLTLHWFCDDHWRFEDYSRFVAPYFHYAATTASSALPKYAALGLADRVIKTQWACNHELYGPQTVAADIPVSFCGMNHGNRPEILAFLEERGLPVQVFGSGWDGRPRLPFHQMVRLFSRSQINLNLSNGSTMAGQQIKGRNFEVPGAGGFLLTGAADNLEEYYTDGQEIAVYHSPEELRDMARYFLAHDDERARIARRGYARTLAEHTWNHRYDAIFRAIGAHLTAQSPAVPMTAPPAVRETRQEESRYRFLAQPDWTDDGGWQAILTAYVAEFGPAEPVSLVLKPSATPGLTIQDMAAEADRFLEQTFPAAETPDIVFEDYAVPQNQVRQFYQSSDCFVQHAPEGREQPAERDALAAGLPVLVAETVAELRHLMRQEFAERQSLRLAA